MYTSSIGFLLDFELSGVVLGVGRCPIGFVAPWRFKTLDSQPGKCNMGSVSIDFHDFRLFRKRCHGFLARYLSCFRPGRQKIGFSRLSVETKKMRGEKLCRFVVVSARELPYMAFSCQFKIFSFRHVFKHPTLFLSQSSRKSVH